MERETVLVDTQVGVPSEVLRGHITYHGYDVVGAAPGVHRGLPSPHLTFVVTLDDPLAMLGPRGLVRRDTVLGGLHAEPVTIVHDGTQRGVHVAIDLLAARRLLGAPEGGGADGPVRPCSAQAGPSGGVGSSAGARRARQRRRLRRPGPPGTRVRRAGRVLADALGRRGGAWRGGRRAAPRAGNVQDVRAAPGAPSQA